MSHQQVPDLSRIRPNLFAPDATWASRIGMKVLIVEDEEVSLIGIAGSIRALGYDVFTATDGAEALTVIQQEKIGVVVSDWQMPVLDGLSLCREIRAHHLDYIYFILLSIAEPTDENHASALSAGVDDFLTKPISKRELVGRLHVAERILKFTRDVHQLESFLPICSHCKSIRDDQNYWQKIENYIRQRTGTEFSHGVCPDCYEMYMVPQLRQLGIEPSPS